MYHLLLTDPRSEYESRRRQWRAQAAAHAAGSERFTAWRGWLGLGLLLAGLGAWRGWWTPGGILLPIAIFAVVAILHERLARRERAAERVAAYYERGLERINGRGAEPRARPFATPITSMPKTSIYSAQALCSNCFRWPEPCRVRRCWPRG